MECPHCKYKFGIELDNLDIHLKGMPNKERIKILHINWKLQQKFTDIHRGTIVDLKQHIRDLIHRINKQKEELAKLKDNNKHIKEYWRKKLLKLTNIKKHSN